MDKNIWLLKAHDDLSWTEANIREAIYYGACFTAHQAAEKALKAYLFSCGRPLRRIHDLGALLEECIQQDVSFESLRNMVLPLVDYYVQTRYPDAADFLEYTKETASQAQENANKIVSFISDRIK